MIYAGALLPAGVVDLDAFLAGLRALRKSAPGYASWLRVHFVGIAGRSPDDRLRAPRAAAGARGRRAGDGPRASSPDQLSSTR